MAHARTRNRAGIRSNQAVQPQHARTVLIVAILAVAGFTLSLGVAAVGTSGPGSTTLYATLSVVLWLVTPALAAGLLARPANAYRRWALFTTSAGLAWAVAGALHAAYIDDTWQSSGNVFTVMLVMLALPQLFLVGGTGMLTRAIRRARDLKHS